MNTRHMNKNKFSHSSNKLEWEIEKNKQHQKEKKPMKYLRTNATSGIGPI